MTVCYESLLDLAFDLFAGLPSELHPPEHPWQEPGSWAVTAVSDLVGEDAVIDRWNLGQPIGEVLPDRLAAEEGIRPSNRPGRCAPPSSEPTAPDLTRIFW